MTREHSYNINLITDEDIRTLLAYIPYFESENNFGEYAKFENGSVGNSILSEKASDFMRACYDHHFVQPFDWSKWAEKNYTLSHEGKDIDTLNLEGIGKLLTTHCRTDRFCDGHLLNVMENGQILRILTRLKQIAWDRKVTETKYRSIKLF